MATVTATYAIKYELEFAPHYVWLNNNSCYNLKTGRFIRQVVVGGCVGYCINGKFKSLASLRNSLIKPKKIECPF